MVKIIKESQNGATDWIDIIETHRSEIEDEITTADTDAMLNTNACYIVYLDNDGTVWTSCTVSGNSGFPRSVYDGDTIEITKRCYEFWSFLDDWETEDIIREFKSYLKNNQKNDFDNYIKEVIYEHGVISEDDLCNFDELCFNEFAQDCISSVASEYPCADEIIDDLIKELSD